METKNLMLCDWVLIPDHQYAPATVPARVTMLNDCNALTVFRDGGDCILLMDEIEPIPLTPEILEKNGFEVSSEHAHFYFEENGYDDGEIKHSFALRKMYRIDNTKEQKGWAFYAFNVLTIIDYVHELQHALKLCGIKKEIVL